MLEKKERRNILVHNDLRIDKKYIRNTKCAHNRIRIKLVINGKYIAETIELLQGILVALKVELLSIYNEYNRSLLLRTVWNYVFASPLLIYDDYWNQADFFIFQNNKKFNISDLSSGEKTMLAFWLQHYSSDIVDRYFTFKDMSMSAYRTKRMNFLVEFFNKYPLILQHG